MDLLDILLKYWPLLLPSLGLVVWLVRIEGESNNTRERLSHLEAQVESIEGSLVREIGAVKEALARIEGYLKARCDQGDCVGSK